MRGAGLLRGCAPTSSASRRNDGMRDWNDKRVINNKNLFSFFEAKYTFLLLYKNNCNRKTIPKNIAWPVQITTSMRHVDSPACVGYFYKRRCIAYVRIIQRNSHF